MADQATLAAMAAMFLHPEFERPLPDQCVDRPSGYACTVVDIDGIVAEHSVRSGYVIGLAVRSTDQAICTILHAEYAKRLGVCMSLLDGGTTSCWDSTIVTRRWSYSGAVCAYSAHLAASEQTAESWPATLDSLQRMAGGE